MSWYAKVGTISTAISLARGIVVIAAGWPKVRVFVAGSFLGNRRGRLL